MTQPRQALSPVLAILSGGFLLALHGVPAEITVKKSGGDYSSIQAAVNAAQPGDTVTVYAGTYFERVELTKTNLLLRVHSNDFVCLNGSNRQVSAKPHMIGVYNGVAALRIQGFQICSNLNGSGIHVEASGTDLAIAGNRIWKMRGTDGIGIAIFGTNASRPISNVWVCGNEIFDCEPAESEALVVNGNVTHFWILSNFVHEVNNIGIDMIGGEDWIPSGARHGVCAENVVRSARSSYGGGYAAGIYVDGGRDIVVEHNVVTESDLGLEVGAENAGWNASNVVVRSNLLAFNDKVGLAFGGYEAGVGRVVDCRFFNNTIYRNANTGDWQGEIIVSWASNCVVENNIVWLSPCGQRYAVLDAANSGNVSNLFDYNLYFADGPATNARFKWKGTTHYGFTAYAAAVRPNETNSLWADPAFANAGATNLRLTAASPALDRGQPAPPGDVGERDLDGNVRTLNGRTDLGAYEYLYLEHAPTGAIEGIAVVTTRWSAVAGARYRVERRDDLLQGGWEDASGIVTAQANAITCVEADSTVARRYYRGVRLLP